MKKLKNRLNSKSKGEQLFIMMIVFAMLIGVLGITGCGGKSCETPSLLSVEKSGVSVSGASIPGCGGILCSGSGCNTPLWPQACKVLSLDDSNIFIGINGTANAIACDIEYYGSNCSGCLGCGSVRKDCYAGCVEVDDVVGCVYGSSDTSEHIIGWQNDTFKGCMRTDGIGIEIVNFINDMLGDN